MRYSATMEQARYSYRDDPSVPAFDDAAPLIIFDGLCLLCSTGVQWMLARDPKGISRFAAIQDPVPQALYQHYGLDAQRFDTFMVLSGGAAYTRWAGVVAAGETMPWPWRGLAAAGHVVPRFIGDAIYNAVQRNRLGWFGSRAECFIPAPAQRHRFLNDAASAADRPPAFG